MNQYEVVSGVGSRCAVSQSYIFTWEIDAIAQFERACASHFKSTGDASLGDELHLLRGEIGAPIDLNPGGPDVVMIAEHKLLDGRRVIHFKAGDWMKKELQKIAAAQQLD